jgi:hypothetical protein
LPGLSGVFMEAIAIIYIISIAIVSYELKKARKISNG